MRDRGLTMIGQTSYSSKRRHYTEPAWMCNQRTQDSPILMTVLITTRATVSKIKETKLALAQGSALLPMP